MSIEDCVSRKRVWSTTSNAAERLYQGKAENWLLFVKVEVVDDLHKGNLRRVVEII